MQQEDRTLWQARDVYLTMSPFLMADKIKTPVLLVHGMEDNNTGTFPMQVHFPTPTVLCSAIHYSAVKCSAGQCSVVLCRTVGH